MNTEATSGYREPQNDEALRGVGDFSPPRIPRGKRSLTRIYTGGILLSFIVLAYALTPGGWGAVPAFFVFGFSASHVLLRHGDFWWPANPNPFRRRAMTGWAAVGFAAVASLAIALPGSAVVGLLWAIVMSLVALQNYLNLGTVLDPELVGMIGAGIVIVGMVAATAASYNVALRLFPRATDA